MLNQTINPRSPLLILTIGHGKQHIGVAWSTGFTPANQIPPFQLPASIIVKGNDPAIKSLR
jgi:hypothetical protein